MMPLRVAGIGPASYAWEAHILPLYDTRALTKARKHENKKSQKTRKYYANDFRKASISVQSMAPISSVNAFPILQLFSSKKRSLKEKSKR